MIFQKFGGFFGLTLESAGSSLPQENALVLERLPRPHHVLLAEGVAVLQLGGAAVLHAVPHLLQPLVPLVLADAQVHGGDHLPDMRERLREVGVLLRFLCGVSMEDSFKCNPQLLVRF